MTNEVSILMLSSFSQILLSHCRKGSANAAAPENGLSYQYYGQIYTNNGGPILYNDHHFRGLEFRNTSLIGKGIIFSIAYRPTVHFCFPLMMSLISSQVASLNFSIRLILRNYIFTAQAPLIILIPTAVIKKPMIRLRGYGLNTMNVSSGERFP